MNRKNEQRKYERYDTQVKVYYFVTYDVETKVRFQLLDKAHRKNSPQYTAVSKNVSAEGICFSSGKELHKGDCLFLEVLLPGSKTFIPMDGEVRWCRKAGTKFRPKFDVGVKLIKVDSQSVEKSIYSDADYQVVWSIVLESILGNFRILEQKRKGILLG